MVAIKEVKVWYKIPKNNVLQVFNFQQFSVTNTHYFLQSGLGGFKELDLLLYFVKFWKVIIGQPTRFLFPTIVEQKLAPFQDRFQNILLRLP